MVAILEKTEEIKIDQIGLFVYKNLHFKFGKDSKGGNVLVLLVPAGPKTDIKDDLRYVLEHLQISFTDTKIFLVSKDNASIKLTQVIEENGTIKELRHRVFCSTPEEGFVRFGFDVDFLNPFFD